MNAYLHFMGSHPLVLIRCFFGVAVAGDLVFVYAMAFDRDLPQRIGSRFFGALSGQRVTMAPAADEIAWWQWLGFGFVSAVPVAVWIATEWHFARNFS